ncbi:unnamed protein product [Periconia digitata]|uniref:Transmembrane protein n=1 Tax=Periconia digitata TaxID=1303443 RepID=A0A9W4XYM9_9PLEO|nr:unnamed protein product [Periconia digitata]
MAAFLAKRSLNFRPIPSNSGSPNPRFRPISASLLPHLVPTRDRPSTRGIITSRCSKSDPEEDLAKWQLNLQGGKDDNLNLGFSSSSISQQSAEKRARYQRWTRKAASFSNGYFLGLMLCLCTFTLFPNIYRNKTEAHIRCEQIGVLYDAHKMHEREEEKQMMEGRDDN